MILHKKKIIKGVFPVLAILTLGISLPLIIIKNNSTQSYQASKIIAIKSSNKEKGYVFPKLHFYDFYKYIKWNYNAPYISKEFISAVIMYVMKNSKVIDGKIKYNFILSKDKQNVKLQFWWEKGNQIIDSKQYQFNISV